MTRTSAILDAGWPIKYVSLWAARAENSWRMQRMLILNSAWPFSPMRSTSSWRCTRIPESATTFTNSAFYVRVVGPAVSVLVRINTVFSTVVCVQFGTRTFVAATGWLLKPEGWDIGYLGNPEGRPFHPPGGISRRSKPSTATRKLLVASSPPTLEEPVDLGRRVNLIAPTPFAINMAYRRSAGVRVLSIISIGKTNAAVPELSNENKVARWARGLPEAWNKTFVW